jgi:hypothetical protein
MSRAAWFARLVVGTVFAVNVWCALVFILQPEQFVAGFELQGVAGLVMVQSIGILFLMWNVTYPPVLYDPRKYIALFAVLLVQQLIGVVGETWLWLSLPPGHVNLSASGARFIAFDAAGLAAMSIAFVLLAARGTMDR